MAKVVIFTKFNRPENPVVEFHDEHLARKEFEAECNINNILAKFKVTGVLVDPSVRSMRQPMFLDCTSIPDMQQYHKILSAVSDSFDNLPDEVKKAFEDNPLAAMQWFSQASDRQVVELWRSLGLDANDAKIISKPAEEPALDPAQPGKAAPGDNPGAA